MAGGKTRCCSLAQNMDWRRNRTCTHTSKKADCAQRAVVHAVFPNAPLRSFCFIKLPRGKKACVVARWEKPRVSYSLAFSKCAGCFLRAHEKYFQWIVLCVAPPLLPSPEGMLRLAWEDSRRTAAGGGHCLRCMYGSARRRRAWPAELLGED